MYVLSSSAIIICTNYEFTTAGVFVPVGLPSSILYLFAEQVNVLTDLCNNS